MAINEPGLIDSGTDVHHVLQDRAQRREAARIGNNDAQQAEDTGAALSEAARTLALRRRELSMTQNNQVLPEGATDNPGEQPDPVSQEARQDINEILDGEEAEESEAAETEESSEVAAEADDDVTQDEPAEIELVSHRARDGREVHLPEDAVAYVSELERSIADQEASPVNPEMQHWLAQAQGTLQQLAHLAGQAGQATPPDMAMLDPNSERYNPEQWTREDAFYRHAKEQQGQAAEQHRALLQRVQGEQQALLARKWPEYSDPEKGADVRGRARKMLIEDVGFSEQELSMLADHRIGVLVRDALAYRELKSGLPKTRAKLKSAPKRAVRPGHSHGPDIRNMEREQELKAAAAESGSLDAVYNKRRFQKDRNRANGADHV